MRNLLFVYAKTKAEISCEVTAFVFATLMVQSLSFLNLKFHASSHLLWLYSLVRKSEDRSSHDAAQI